MPSTTPCSCIFRLLAPLLLLLLAAMPAQSADEWILLISRPDLWSAPCKDAPAVKKKWEAGKRLKVLNDQREVEHDRLWRQVATGKDSGWLPDAFLAPPPQPLDPKDLATIGREPVDRHHGLVPEYAPPDLASVGPPYDKDMNFKLRREAAVAFKSMLRAARADGVKLFIVSAYRPWTKQQKLYARRVRRSGWEQKTVARPGHSEHQLGTAVDLTDGNEKTLLKESFGASKAGRWLHDHAWEYGFAVSYTRHNQPQTGYAPEPWHYRYWGLAHARTRHFTALGEKDKLSPTAQ